MCEYNNLSQVYLTAEEVNNMNEDELVWVNRIAINSRITELQIQQSGDKEELQILIKASRQIKEREKKRRAVGIWGAKMTVKDVKRAFGDLSNMSKTYFKRII